MPHADKVVVPHTLRVSNRLRSVIAVVHPDTVAVGIASNLRNPDPHRGIAALIPLFDLVGQLCAVSGKEPQIRAIVLGLRIVDVARIENSQNGKVGQRFRLSKIVKRKLLPSGPVCVPPVKVIAFIPECFVIALPTFLPKP